MDFFFYQLFSSILYAWISVSEYAGSKVHALGWNCTHLLCILKAKLDKARLELKFKTGPIL